MKPGDHPEFFRFPAPEGRSRESSIVLSRDGRFFHEGTPVEHLGMQRAFAAWLRRHPDDGRFILSNGYDWSYLTVEAAPYFVRAVRAVDGLPHCELLDGSQLPLDAAAVTCDAEGVLWLDLPAGEAARFTPAAQLELSPWLVEQAGEVGLAMAGRFSRIERRTSAEVGQAAQPTSGS
jgi:uncharacterized protein